VHKAPGRPRRRRGAAAERQAAAITARDIARRAVVSDGVLYNHFDDKHELVVAALVRRFERLVEAFQAEISTAAPSPAPPRLEIDLERLAGASFRLHAAALPMLANVLSGRPLPAVHAGDPSPPLGPRVFMTRPRPTSVRSAMPAGSATSTDAPPGSRRIDPFLTLRTSSRPGRRGHQAHLRDG
jgi:AcrR family transcriptional regulator